MSRRKYNNILGLSLNLCPRHLLHPRRQDTGQQISKVLFRSVPLNVSDEEILHLCAVYSDVVDGIKREKLYNNKDMGRTGSNRMVEIIFNDGMSFDIFYWLEGALPGDQGRRVTVTHHGQLMQCSH